jgi:hypothetical protein
MSVASPWANMIRVAITKSVWSVDGAIGVEGEDGGEENRKRWEAWKAAAES